VLFFAGKGRYEILVGSPSNMKIATFNINNINKRLNNLLTWLAKAQPDVVCLQELKVEQRMFPSTALRDLGYRGIWLGER
jgi:exodeoxyribonuclease-3